MELKEKNRERLIWWLRKHMVRWFADAEYAEYVIDEGFKGLNNFTDKELLDEYKLQVKENEAPSLSLMENKGVSNGLV